MKNTISTSVNFYRNIGKLFYAIAAADGHVSSAEYEKLKELVKNDWLEVDHIEDSFGTDTAYQIEIVFDWLSNENQLKAKTCFDDFIDYKKKHDFLFNDTVKKLIMKTADAIASTFNNKNKSELIMLARLEMCLK